MNYRLSALSAERRRCQGGKLAASGQEEVPVMQPTIALVDDDRNILTSVTMALEDEGFKVRSAARYCDQPRGPGGPRH
jgi:two-component system response regulator ChvI